MAEVTVQQFARVVGISVDRLVQQLAEAGLPAKVAGDMISDDEKTQLLTYLRRIHGKQEAAPEPAKITLKRKTVSELKVQVDRGRPRTRGAVKPATPAKTVSVEVRKKRTYVKRSVVAEEEAARIEKETAERDRVRAEEEAVLQAEEARVAEQRAREEAEAQAAQAQREAEDAARAALEQAGAEADVVASALPSADVVPVVPVEPPAR